MRTIPISAVGTVSQSVLSQVSDAFGARYTLAAVLQWAREQQPARSVVEIVTQDEYTHDVILPFDGSHFLVFDAT